MSKNIKYIGNRKFTRVAELAYPVVNSKHEIVFPVGTKNVWVSYRTSPITNKYTGENMNVYMKGSTVFGM